MSYWNPVLHYGVDAFARDLAAALGELARWLQGQGVRTLAVVQPHDQGRRPWADRGLHRGDRVPQDERAKQYVVDDWQGHGLRRPPRGYHWVQNGGDYLLVAITTGIILELLLSR